MGHLHPLPSLEPCGAPDIRPLYVCVSIPDSMSFLMSHGIRGLLRSYDLTLIFNVVK